MNLLCYERDLIRLSHEIFSHFFFVKKRRKNFRCRFIDLTLHDWQVMNNTTAGPPEPWLWDIFSYCELVWFLDEISQESNLLEKMHMGWPGDGLCYCANKDQSREIFKQVDSETVCEPWSKEASKRINILLCWAQDGQLFLHFDSNNFKFFDLYICLKWVVTLKKKKVINKQVVTFYLIQNKKIS